MFYVYIYMNIPCTFRIFMYMVIEYLAVGLVDTFQVENHILSLILRINGMIGCMVRNFISREANDALKYI